MSYFEEKKRELEDLIKLIQKERYEYEKSINAEKERNIVEILEKEQKTIKKIEEQERILDKKQDLLAELEEGVNILRKQRQIGFPWLANAYDDAYRLQDEKLARYLEKKKRPAYKAAELLREQTELKRQALKQAKVANYILEYYENIAPFLFDLREELDGEDEELVTDLSEYTEEEKSDETVNYLTKEEYRKLLTTERNQMALDRFWKRPKSKWLIGKLYERYVGYLYEEQGYDVDYVGIFKGYEDLGRDLICKKGKEIVVIQCKNWSKFRTLYEKHIFQFFGTVFQYRDENQDSVVRAMFYCTTKLSKLAKRFSKELGIGLEENHKFDQDYPCIKCNISKVDGTKIYHLPFDQQYDKVKIEKDKGEFYCKTVEEAEKAGFRRAFRYRPSEN